MPRIIKSFVDKTLKREIAIALLVFFCSMVWVGMSGTDPAIISAKTALVATISWPIISFAAIAFGMEWVSKQTEWAQGPLIQPTPTNPNGEVAG